MQQFTEKNISKSKVYTQIFSFLKEQDKSTTFGRRKLFSALLICSSLKNKNKKFLSLVFFILLPIFRICPLCSVGCLFCAFWEVENLVFHHGGFYFEFRAIRSRLYMSWQQVFNSYQNCQSQQGTVKLGH